MLIRVLPSTRQVVLLMTPREASLLEGQILEPGDYPWQDTEAEMVGQEAKNLLHSAVTNVTSRELDEGLVAMERAAMIEKKAKQKEETDAKREQDDVSGVPGTGDRDDSPEDLPVSGETASGRASAPGVARMAPNRFFNRRRTQDHE